MKFCNWQTMENNYFWAEEEIAVIQNPRTRLYDNQQAYKEALTRFLLSGLKNLGYNESYKLLEKESRMQLPKLIDDDLKTYIRQEDLDSAIGHLLLNDTRQLYNERNREVLLYEILKLKFVQSIIKGNTLMALFLLRNDLKEFKEFESEKKKLSSLYLLKTAEEISEVSGINLNDPEFMESFINKLELKLLHQEYGCPMEDPFDYLCRNSLCYEIIACKYHKSFNFINTPVNQLGISNGLKHHCELEYFPIDVYQTLDESNDELWEVKISSNGRNIYALTRDRIFMCWAFNSVSRYYEHSWISDEPIKEEINDWKLNEKNGTIVIGTAENAIKIIGTEGGRLLTTMQTAHDDSVNNIYVKRQGDEIISVSVDCNIKIWDYKQLSNKAVIKTKRALSMLMGQDEETAYIIYNNYKNIDKVNLSDRTTQEKVIIEKDSIISSCISPNGNMLLLNVGKLRPELHLYRLNDFRLLNIYKGHIQTKFCIGIGFLNDYIIYSGSEDGHLVYWHINNTEPIKKKELHTLSLNSVASAFNEVLKRQIVVTASDDYKLKILI